jgi:3-oxoadipate enol-lactonase
MSSAESGYAEVNGARLYYEVTGESDPIVLLHGNGGDCRHWDNQFEAFSQSHRVLRYDIRGFGRSSMPEEGIPYCHHDDLKALMGHLDIEKAHICGLSMGCGMAVDFVLAHPDSSRSLIAVGPWVFGYDSPAVRRLFAVTGEIPDILEERGVRAAIDVWCDHIFAGALETEGAKWTRQIGYDYSFWGFKHEDPAVYVSPRAAQQLGGIFQPTLIVTADRDLDACREVADLMEQKIPNSVKVEFTDAGHVMNVDHPDKFNRLVLAFIEGL